MLLAASTRTTCSHPVVQLPRRHLTLLLVTALLFPHPQPSRQQVVIASRPNATGRAILNEQELLDACSQMDPQQQLEDAGEPGWAKGAESYRGERRAFKRVKCVAHVFGRDIMYDLALAQVRKRAE